jgi:hypothetical protein
LQVSFELLISRFSCAAKMEVRLFHDHRQRDDERILLVESGELPINAD